MYNKFPQGSIIVIDGAKYMPHGETDGRLRFVHLVTADFYRCLQPDGSLALPTSDQFDDLLFKDRALIQSIASSSTSIRRVNEEAEWTINQIDDLDQKPGGCWSNVGC